MFESLKSKLSNEDSAIFAGMLLSEMASEDSVEDMMLDDIVIPAEEEKKIEALLDKIPDNAIGNSEDLNDEDLSKEMDGIPDPTMEELLDGDL